MDSNGVEVLRGPKEDGIYVTSSLLTYTKKHQIFLTKFRPSCLCDQIHLITERVHPGDNGMK